MDQINPEIELVVKLSTYYIAELYLDNNQTNLNVNPYLTLANDPLYTLLVEAKSLDMHKLEQAKIDNYSSWFVRDLILNQ